MKKIILGMLVLAAVTGTSCKKDKDNNGGSCDKTVGGIANTFKLTAYKATTAGIEQDLYAAFDACDKNSAYNFKSDKSVDYAGGTNCSGSDGSWDVVSEKVTIAAGVVGISNANIDSWDCTTLKLSSSQTISGITFTTSVTFVKQ